MRSFLLSSILTSCALLHPISASPVDIRADSINLCNKNYHPDFNCTKGLLCQSDWPSEIGNYGSIDRRARSINRTGQSAITFQMSLPGDIATAAEDGTNNETTTTLLHTLQERSPAEACCRPTVEYFEFWGTIKLKGFAYPTRLLIDGLEVWKRAEWCLQDFLTPKAWCSHPPARERAFTWQEPPKCARF
ncbi:hypothetical protein A1O1_00285, partial [Capronia coronata CBS 617.96]